MATIISKGGRHYETIVENVLVFMRANATGYGFPCTEQGEPLFDSEGAEKNYRYAMEHPLEFERAFNMHQRCERTASWWEPAVLKCDCGRELELLSYDANDCDCGRCYNASGQSLDPHAAHCYICGELGGDCNREGDW